MSIIWKYLVPKKLSLATHCCISGYRVLPFCLHLRVCAERCQANRHANLRSILLYDFQSVSHKNKMKKTQPVNNSKIETFFWKLRKARVSCYIKIKKLCNNQQINTLRLPSKSHVCNKFTIFLYLVHCIYKFYFLF